MMALEEKIASAAAGGVQGDGNPSETNERRLMQRKSQQNRDIVEIGWALLWWWVQRDSWWLMVVLEVMKEAWFWLTK